MPLLLIHNALWVDASTYQYRGGNLDEARG